MSSEMVELWYPIGHLENTRECNLQKLDRTEGLN